MFSFAPKEIHIWFSEVQGAYSEIVQNCPTPVYLHQELPNTEELPPQDSIIIWDDFQSNSSATEVINRFFLKICRHNKLTGICILQNLFDTRDKFIRSINLNCNVLVLFRNIRDSLLISHLSKQVFPGKNNILLRILNEITRDNPRGYLAIYFDPEIHSWLRLRDSLFVSDKDTSSVYSLH